MTVTDNELAAAINDPGSPRVGFRQGTVIEFDTSTGKNTIDVGDAQLEDVPCLNVTDAVGMLPGMVVGLLTFQSSWWIMGRIAVPGTSDFGDIVIHGGALRVRYTDGSTAMLLGPFNEVDTAGTTFSLSHGIIIQDDVAGDGLDILRARRLGDGTKRVTVGQEFAPVTSVRAYTTFAEILVTGQATIESGTSNLFLRSTGSDVNVQADGGSIWLQSSNNATHIEHVIDTGLAANTHIGGDGRIWSTASSRRYKTDIADAEINPADVLQLQPRVWKDRASEKPGVGFIAEEMAELGSLDQFVVYDDKGPQSIAYDRLTAALVPVMQKQQQQINDLTARLEALEARL